MLKMIRYSDGANRGEIDTATTLAQIQATNPQFFRNKPNGAKERYRLHQGCLIVYTKPQGEPERRAVWAYFPKGHHNATDPRPALAHIGLGLQLPNPQKAIDEIVTTGIAA